ncbi:hypothetical protein SAMN05216574_1164 [Blastococcus tunisiensis]|uniref:Uncharacterized protein n=1 Tax=Blastococcus tunisiensis TaxID=1798228 RepID=A0A1I2JDI2_9ACTN|nr:hypothetical protein SAMN05216574_1164 [Blastococcus sp. DSM 46838]
MDSACRRDGCVFTAQPNRPYCSTACSELWGRYRHRFSDPTYAERWNEMLNGRPEHHVRAGTDRLSVQFIERRAAHQRRRRARQRMAGLG